MNESAAYPRVYFYIDDVVMKTCSPTTNIVEKIYQDTTICEDRKIQLLGLVDADNYY